jgi:hypothetical protein
VGKPEGRRPLERPRRRWKDKLDLRGVSQWSMDWIDLAEDRDKGRAVLNVVMNLQVPQNAGNFLSS